MVREPRPFWASVLALAGPLVVAFVAWRIYSADLQPSLDVSALEARVHVGDGGVVLVGGSAAESALSPDAFATENRPAIGLFVSGSAPAHWYAILRDHVFASGAHPREIVLYSTPDLLRVTGAAGDMASLLDLVAPDDSIVLDKVFAGARVDAAQARSEQIAARTRADLVTDVVRPSISALIFLFPRHDGAVGGTDQRIHHAMAMTLTSRGHIVDVENLERAPETHPVSEPVADSFVVDLAALARANGAHLVVVLGATTTPWICDSRGIDPEASTALIDAGADVIDLSNLSYPKGAFLDRVHLSPQGKDLTTAATLSAFNALVDAPASARGRFVPPVCR